MLYALLSKRSTLLSCKILNRYKFTAIYCLMRIPFLVALKFWIEKMITSRKNYLQSFSWCSEFGMVVEFPCVKGLEARLTFRGVKRILVSRHYYQPSRYLLWLHLIEEILKYRCLSILKRHLLGVKQCRGHAQIGLFQGSNSLRVKKKVRDSSHSQPMSFSPFLLKNSPRRRDQTRI